MPTNLPLLSKTDFRISRSLEEAQAETDGARAFRVFCTPSLSSRRGPDHHTLVERARHHLRSAQAARTATSRGQIQTYVFEPAAPAIASVLVVHGWTGEAAFMGAFADFLRRRGFRAVLMDMPAHGLSEGTATTLMDCARAVLDVAETMGPFHFALGHSIGAMAVLTAGEGRRPLPRAYPFGAYALVASPDRFADVTAQFAKELSLSAAAQRSFERRLERLAQRTLADFTGARLVAATSRPTLVLHSRDDDDVPFAAATSLAAAPNATLAAFDGLGHRAILYSPPAVRAAAAFLSGLAETR
jgi:pimeloyl-ACP methyl ester carboxylesterase